MQTDRSAPGGVFQSARAGLLAAALSGLVLGLVDAGFATSALLALPTGGGSTRVGLGVGSALACGAGTVLQYSIVFALLLVVLGVLLHPLIARLDLAGRYLVLLALGLGAGFTAELYWRTRDVLFYGKSALSPERLAVAGGALVVGLALGFVAARGLARLSRRVQVAFSAACALAWLVGGVWLAMQESGSSARGAKNDRNADLPNVLLVVVDALRQDELGCYGNTRVKTPNFDRLAERGVLFENAFVQAPFTWTSFGSLLTGKYPRRHGMLRMKPGYQLRAQATLPWHLKHATRLDGRALQPDDYVTASFHTGTLQEGTGLLRGFDLVFEETAGHELQDLASPWSQFRAELLLWIFKNRIEKRFDSGLVAKEARRWIAEQRGKRFMAMVHLYSTHTPYDPPQEFARMYRDPAYTGPVKAFYAEHRYAIESGKYTPTAADVQAIRDLYSAGVSQADALVGDLVRELERAGELANTLVIVTADHGESLGEDGLWEHNHMVRRELRVPLLIAWPTKLPAGKRVAALTDEIDVFPTVCDLAGLTLPKAEDEYAKLDGASLLPLVRGEKDALRRFSFAENGVRLSIQDLGAKLDVPRSVVLQKDAQAARAELEKTLRTKETAPRYVEYANPRVLDEVDVLAEKKERALALLDELFAWSTSMPIPAEMVRASGRDEETHELLRHTGYEGGVGDDGPPPEEDPKSAPEDGRAPTPGAPR